MNNLELNGFLYDADFETFCNSFLTEVQTERIENMRGQILSDYAISAIHWEDKDSGDRTRLIMAFLPFMTLEEKHNYVLTVLKDSRYVLLDDTLGMESLSLN